MFFYDLSVTAKEYPLKVDQLNHYIFQTSTLKEYFHARYTNYKEKEMIFMWKVAFIIGFTFLSFQPTPILTTFTSSLPVLLEEIPPYAKWGRLAMKETKEKYPEAAIIDYLHIGKTVENEKTTEKFKLWLRGKDKEFGVFININYNTATEKVLEITMEETDR